MVIVLRQRLSQKVRYCASEELSQAQIHAPQFVEVQSDLVKIQLVIEPAQAEQFLEGCKQALQRRSLSMGWSCRTESFGSCSSRMLVGGSMPSRWMCQAYREGWQKRKLAIFGRKRFLASADELVVLCVRCIVGLRSQGAMPR
jgi:hypothetical protein